MTPYIHRVAYYETDRMGITHHSNYIRWMEEARVDYLEQLGWSFAKLEEAGVTSPVLDVSCVYKKTTTFDDRVEITVGVAAFTGVRTTFSYTMRKLDSAGQPGDVVCTATSQHCFLDPSGRPMRVDRQIPAFAEALSTQVQAADRH